MIKTQPDFTVQLESAEDELVPRTIADLSDAVEMWRLAAKFLCDNPQVDKVIKNFLRRTDKGVNSILGYGE